MPFTVDDFQDLLRLLEQRPEWRAQLRQLLLPEELLELPSLVRQLVEVQRATLVRLERVEGRLDRVEGALHGLVEVQRASVARLDRVEGGLHRLGTDVGVLKGGRDRGKTSPIARAILAPR